MKPYTHFVIAVAFGFATLPTSAVGGTFSDSFDDGELAPWVSLHGTNTESGGSLNGSSYSTHVTPSAVIDTGMGGVDHVILSANLRVDTGGGGFTFKRNGGDNCGFFIWSQTTIYISSDNVIETGVYSSPGIFTFGVDFLLEAELAAQDRPVDGAEGARAEELDELVACDVPG